jgi:hypothetical protein
LDGHRNVWSSQRGVQINWNVLVISVQYSEFQLGKKESWLKL